MSHTTTVPLLTLEEWAEQMAIDPWSLNQVSSPTGRNLPCEQVWYQHSWQKDFIAREELARTIAQAEAMLARYLGYWPAPYYEFDETVVYPRPHDRRQYGYAVDPRGEWKSVNLNWKRFIGGGQFNRSDISSESITYKDLDNDGVYDHFEVTATTTITDTSEIALYFASGDRLTQAVSEQWRIRPVDVTISGGVATIKGHVTLLVRPELQEPTIPAELDPEDASGNIYVDTVEVKRAFRDTTATDAAPTQGTAIWDVPLSDNLTAPSEAVEPFQFGNRRNVSGQPYIWLSSPANWPYKREPDRLSAHYLSGVPLVNGRMDSIMAGIVAKLATALLPSEKCGCERSNRIIGFWRRLVDDGTEGSDARNFTLEEINNNPFGEPRRGALQAWKDVASLREIGAVSV